MGDGASKLDSPSKRRLISAEETSALRGSSSRELSEAACQRATLRIAFVMAFSEVSHSNSEGAIAKESSDSNRLRNSTSKGPSIRAQLQPKRDSVHDSRIIKHSSELLRIVFAGSRASSNLISRWHSFESDTSIADVKNNAPATITFAMRHRALRAASILCPQEALEKVVRNAGYHQSSNNPDYCTLHKCSFGVFLAKEIEELGLPLPFSDLMQFSSMDFMSYAKALWRENRDNDIPNNSKGRLLLLLVEMSLQGDEIDVLFVNSMLDEMVRRNLPRTVLMSLEHLANFQDRATRSHSLTGDLVTKAAAALAVASLSEARCILTESISVDQSDDSGTMEMLERLFKIVVSLCNTNEGYDQFNKFADILTFL